MRAGIRVRRLAGKHVAHRAFLVAAIQWEKAIADSTGGVETWPADDFRRVADARRQALESALRAFDGDEGSER
ncbi:hypothetical protein JCM9957A_50470 [Kineosporia succinea]